MNDFLSSQTNLTMMQAAQNSAGRLSQSLKHSAATGKPDEIDAAAEEFEAMFISEMLKPMFEGIEAAAPFGGGKGEEIFQSFLLQEYGKMVAKTGDIGIADHVKQELITLQEHNNNEALSHQ